MSVTSDKTVALVTGASRGIGRATALRLADDGWAIAVNYIHDGEAADAVATEVRQRGQEALVVRADVSRRSEVESMVKRVEDELGPIAVLVNNAGIVRDNLLTFMKDDEWNDVLDTNLKGPFYTTKTVGRRMARRRRGCIVNVSSDAGLLGDMMRANYAAAKAGLVGLTKTAARELAGSGIRVNAVAPGLIDTDLTADMPARKRERHVARIPQGRFGTPGDIANVIAFLASDASCYITGQTLCVDGGLRMQGS